RYGKCRGLLAACGCHLAHDATAPMLSRRQVLSCGAAALTIAAASGSGFQALAQDTKPHRIDVHHHVVPPTWLSAVTRIGKENPPITNWSVQKTIEDMDRGGVATAITSPATPQVGDFPADEAARLARESNEYAKKLESQHPGRFGTFAMLPLPYIEPSLREIEYAFDALKVDGIGCMTSYGTKWLA